MPNTFEYTDWLTMESLRLLVNKLQVAQFFNTDFNKEFTREFPVGSTVRVPLPQQFDVSTGLGYTPQNLQRIHTTVNVNLIRGVHFEWDSAEAALQLSRGRDKIKQEYLEPAMARLAQEIDSLAAQWAYEHGNNIVGAIGTDPATLGPVLSARQRMFELACPPGAKGLIIPPQVNTTLVPVLQGLLNPSDAISRQYKQGTIGRAIGFDWYESMSLWDHTAGTWAGAITISGAGQSGNTLTVTATVGDTFRVGDVFSIANVNAVNPMTKRLTTTATQKQFTVTLARTCAGGVGGDTITFQPAIVGPGSPYQNVDALPVDAAALTLFPGTVAPSANVGKQALAIHRDAFALVGVKLETPQAVELSSQTRDPDTGISVRFVRAWDQEHSRMTNRFDCLFGFGDLYADNCCVRLQCA